MQNTNFSQFAKDSGALSPEGAVLQGFRISTPGLAGLRMKSVVGGNVCCFPPDLRSIHNTSAVFPSATRSDWRPGFQAPNSKPVLANTNRAPIHLIATEYNVQKSDKESIGEKKSGVAESHRDVVKNDVTSCWSRRNLCFARGTIIKTIDGEIPVEQLSVGTQVLTLDAGYQTIRWIGSQRLTPSDLQDFPYLRPIRISEGAFGRSVPDLDLFLSPQHRVLVTSSVARRMFSQSEILVPVRQLTVLEGIDIVIGWGGVEYWHFLLDHHQIVFANGARTETLFMGAETVKLIPDRMKSELLLLFPRLGALSMEHAADSALPARQIVSGQRARRIAAELKRARTASSDITNQIQNWK